jgi:tRNA(fMet)-specific endonuclease VapC
MNLLLDTCFLIAAQRERLRRSGPAIDFLRNHASVSFWVSAVAWGEFAEGRTLENQKLVFEIRAMLEIVPITEAVAEKYGQLIQKLRAKGELIGSNDLWIAATAISGGFQLVTRNKKDFSRIPELKILTY